MRKRYEQKIGTRVPLYEYKEYGAPNGPELLRRIAEDFERVQSNPPGTEVTITSIGFDWEDDADAPLLPDGDPPMVHYASVTFSRREHLSLDDPYRDVAIDFECKYCHADQYLSAKDAGEHNQLINGAEKGSEAELDAEIHQGIGPCLNFGYTL